MLLAGNSAGEVTGLSRAVFTRGAGVAVHVSVPGAEGGQEHFRTQATVTRVLENSNGLGVFEGPDMDGDQPILVRFEWSRTETDSPRWSQAFSRDDGDSWETNWIMDFRRVG